MKKVTLSAIAAVFAIGVAFAGSFSQEGHYLFNPATQQFDKLDQAPPIEVIQARCPGLVQDCYYTLDETGTVKTGIAFRN